jgi:phosphoadenosine phosphosulfate reductase
MPLDEPPLHPFENTQKTPQAKAAALTDLARDLNARLRHHSASDVLRAGFEALPDLALVSSFGAESVALLHLAAMVRRDVPVLFIDTQLLFAETLVYQQELAERLRLSNLRIIRAADLALHDPGDLLHRRDTDACCALRKTAPLAAALKGYDGWISGRKRFQSGSRAALEFFEVETPTDGAPPRLKVNPLAFWSARDVAEYIDENRLPRHPLVARGYPSIGCAPCTTAVAPGEDPRAGRWRNQTKEECGIHFVNGKIVRTGDMQ